MTHICARCGEEVRWGWRPSLTSPFLPAGFWMHREESVDHTPVLGQVYTPEDMAADEAALDVERENFVIPFAPSYYTTRDVDIARMKDKEAQARAEADADGEWVAAELPEPEVMATIIDIRDERMPGGARTIMNLASKNGWDVWGAYSRGPHTHATTGALLRISDYVVVRMLDAEQRRAVACWRDGKFQWAWLLEADRRATRYINHGKTNSDGLKSWIRHEEEEIA